MQNLRSKYNYVHIKTLELNLNCAMVINAIFFSLCCLIYELSKPALKISCCNISIEKKDDEGFMNN